MFANFCATIEKRNKWTRYRAAKNIGLHQTHYEKFRRSSGQRILRNLLRLWQASGLSGTEFLSLLAFHLDIPDSPSNHTITK